MRSRLFLSMVYGMRSALTILIISLLLPCSDSVAQEWTRFRGPNGSGISTATGIPVKWAANDYNWQVDLPVKGSSSPVLWGRQLFLTGDHAENGQRSILCIDADSGRIKWRRDYPIKSHYLHRDNDFTSATPCVDKDGVIFVWSNPEQILMTALSLDGQEMWQRDLGPYKGLHGSSNSPIIADGLVILANDQMDPKRFAFYLPKDTDMEPGKSFLIALDRKTGETRWKVDRKSELAGYATPCIRRSGDRAEAIFSSTAHGITAVDLQSGRVTWEIDKIWNNRTVSSPQLFGDLVFGSFGKGLSGQRFVAVRPEKLGSKKGKLVYEVTKNVPLVPSFVVKGKLIYLWTDSGVVTCLDAATGKLHWRERVGGEFYSSPIWIQGRLYCISKSGQVVVLAAGRKFEVLARTELGEKTFATPAVADGVMYLRTQSRLYSLGKAR
ncbi:MAG: PQQ-binding-like beta-propeller repeat protein [Verrucomicrobia bacterium]|nr:PQQ-binding-like beta-propeller repeat protein [Verrucomicrobiota bacterium]